jgi:sporulation protein YlmC with PRC-barrel domain
MLNRRIDMKRMYLNIGAQIRFRDGAGGTLDKVVIDPNSKRITNLVVIQGFLQKHRYVIPVSTVEKAIPVEIQLGLYAKELTSYPEYSEVDFEEPLDNWESEMIFPHESEVIWYPFGSVIERQTRALLATHRTIPKGIGLNEQVIGHSSVVRNFDGVVGKIDHLWLDRESWEITHLVVRRGLFPHYAVVPYSSIGSVTPDEVFIWASTDRLLAAPITKMQLEATWTSNGDVEKEAYPLDENRAIADATIDALAMDPRAASSVIEVVYERGVLTLMGVVESELVHTAAEEIARQQEGVLTVVNALEIRPKAATVETAADAFGRLIRQPYNIQSGVNKELA